MLAGKQEVKSIAALDEGVRERISSLMNAQLFKHMPFEHLVRCAEAMQEVEVGAGEEVVTPGRPGRLLLRHQGRARPRCGAPMPAEPRSRSPRWARRQLRRGGAPQGRAAQRHGAHDDAPGASSSSARRTSTALLKSQLLHEITADEARRNVDFRGAVFIDCRFEEEWELWRLKGARLVPLEEIRERSRGLDPKREYIVYCRTGRRSRAAAFLMRQAGLNAVALKGGIADWPYEREASDLE